MAKRLAFVILIFLSVSCTADGESAPSTTADTATTAPFEGLTFAIYETDDGNRLRVQTGDRIVARLGLTTQSAPPWRMTSTPNPRILSADEMERVIPPESVTGEPYDETMLRAIGTGTTRFVFEQGGSDRRVEIRVTVTEG